MVDTDVRQPRERGALVLAMASPQPPADCVQLHPEISEETERLLGCLCTPKDSATTSNASRSGRWRGGTAGLPCNTTSARSALSDVRPPAVDTSCRAHTPEPHIALQMQVSTPENPMWDQATASGRQRGIADLGKVCWKLSKPLHDQQVCYC